MAAAQQRPIYLYGKAGELADCLDKRGCRANRILALIIGEFADQFDTIEEAAKACQDKYVAWMESHPDKQ